MTPDTVEMAPVPGRAPARRHIPVLTVACVLVGAVLLVLAVLEHRESVAKDRLYQQTLVRYGDCAEPRLYRAETFQCL